MPFFHRPLASALLVLCLALLCASTTGCLFQEEEQVPLPGATLEGECEQGYTGDDCQTCASGYERSSQREEECVEVATAS